MQTPLLPRVLTAVRHQWLLVTVIIVLGVLAAFVAVHFAHPKYVATTSVLMVASSAEAQGSPDTSTSTKPLLSTDLPSLANGATVLSRLRSDLHETVPLESLRSRVRAKVNSDSTIMQVDYTGKTADSAIEGANALGDEVTRFYRELATTRFDSLIVDLRTQLASRNAELAKLDGDLASASRAYPFINVPTPGLVGSGIDSVYARLVTLRTERDELEATLSADSATALSAHRLIQDANPLAMREIVQSDAVYLRVRDQYSRDLAELKRLSAYGSDGYPGLVELRRTVARERNVVDSERRRAESSGPSSNPAYVAALDAQARADGQVAGDRAKIAAEGQALETLQKQIGRRGIGTNVARMRRDHDNSEAAYAIIASRLAKSIGDRAEAASTGSVVVLEPAQFASKSSSGGTLAAVALVFLSIWLALTVALMVDGSHAWFRDSRTVENIYGAPVIGSLA